MGVSLTDGGHGWGSGLAITQPLGQSTIMPWPLGLACSGAVHAVASCDQVWAPLFRDDDGGPPSAPSGTRCGGSGGGSRRGNSGRAVDQTRGRQPLSGAEKRNL